MYDNGSAIQELVATLRTKRAVLLSGAGTSRSVGYPSWRELVEMLRRRFADHLARPHDATDTAFANEIVMEIRKNRKDDEYHNFLYNTFGPPRDGSPQHSDLHLALVRLPFCGLATTNYERVIESAVSQAFAVNGVPQSCEEIDLCVEPYPVFQFFRELGGKPQRVLHLHGYYKNPKHLILTEDDYLSNYGQSTEQTEDGLRLNSNLNTLHRKVLWALCLSHPLVFIGFSLSDGFFLQILQILKQDLHLGDALVHFAIVPYSTDMQNDQIVERLRLLNTMPIFYYVPPVKENEEQDHSGLKRLVYQLAGEVDVSVLPDSIMAINKKMLEL
jgi:SIR2-like domain